MTTNIGSLDVVPTWSCFDDALDFFEIVVDLDKIVRDDATQHFRIVHGICLGHDAGEPYAHAWVEQSEADQSCELWPPRIIWQAGTFQDRRVYYAVDHDWFYRAFQITRATRYTIELALYLNHVSGHYGPWRREYAELCGRNALRVMGKVEGAAPLAWFFPEDGAGHWPHGLYLVGDQS